MRKTRRQSGFTMAEMLIVVAIILILMMVAAIMVQRHQRSMTQLEYDSIAKELFIAAQNHLTAAESQGYLELDSSQYGTPDTDETDRDVYYFAVNNGAAETGSMLELMLPFGAIDETVRIGGSYLIRYQPSSARILDVFYSDPRRITFLTVRGISLSNSDYSTLMGAQYYGEDNKENRRSYRGSVVGWYGGGDDLPVGEAIEPPVLTVENAETLRVIVQESTPTTNGQSLILLITGENSGAKKTVTLRDNGTAAQSDAKGFLTVSTEPVSGAAIYTLVLDDITKSGLHFAELEADTGNFCPGENLRIEAVSFNNTQLTNIADSGKKTTNSLFADVVKKETAVIASFRHLENLNGTVSGLDSEADVTKAEQTGNLDWPDFLEKVGGSESNPIQIVPMTGDRSKTNCFLPVNPCYAAGAGALESFALLYDGKDHTVSGLKVDCSENAGLFGSLKDGSISNLTVLDSEIKSSDSAAGGLAGSMDGTAVSGCASTALVFGKTAGGLVGNAAGGSITESYSGGHTRQGSYLDVNGLPIYNVQGTVTAGGLVGDAANTEIQYCYSTCSASAATAGGFAGTVSGSVSVQDSYCTGLVNGTASSGAFVGNWEENNTSVSSGNRYYQIINGDMIPGVTGVSAIDESLASYDSFVGGPDTWAAAKPTDSTLTTYYQRRFNLRTTDQLKTDGRGSTTETHYGDWPAPEILFINN